VPTRKNTSKYYDRGLFDEFFQPPLPFFVTSPSDTPPPPDGKQRYVAVLNMTDFMLELAARDFDYMYQVTDEQFEVMLCRLFDKHGFETWRVPGGSRSEDGGIDILAYPRQCPMVPFFFAIQAKHHQVPKNVGPEEVRAFSDVVRRNHLFHAGLLITNTSFTANARFVVEHTDLLVRLRDGKDLARWLQGSVIHSYDWREVPERLQVTPNKYVTIPRPFGTNQQNTFWDNA
jgi:hypothetical protein